MYYDITFDKDHTVLATKIKPVYILFTIISEVCFVFNRCITCRLNKLKHTGDETNRFHYINISKMHFFCAHKEIILIYFEHI